MKKRLGILLLLLATIVFWMPPSAEASAQPGKGKSNKSWKQKGLWNGNISGRRRYQGRNRNTYGYRNYGQYRRTQVGNRRYRTVRRYYWQDGVRLFRSVRVY